MLFSPVKQNETTVLAFRAAEFRLDLSNCFHEKF